MDFVCALLAVLFPAVSTIAAPQPEVRRISIGIGDTVVATSYDSPTQLDRGSVILVPGLLGAAFTFRDIAPRLAEAGYDVTIVEPLGFGAASRPKDGDYSLEAQATRVGRAADSLGVASATFVCHSVGASICMRLSLQRPALTRGIISINGGPDETAGTSGLRTSLKLAPLIKVLGAQRIIRGKIKDGLRESSADASWVTDAVIKGYTKPYVDFNAVLTAARGMVNAREPAPLRPRLSRITVPVTLLIGTGKPERSIKPEDVQVLQESITQLKIENVEGAGQFIHEERPEAIVQAVRSQRGGGS